MTEDRWRVGLQRLGLAPRRVALACGLVALACGPGPLGDVGSDDGTTSSSDPGDDGEPSEPPTEPVPPPRTELEPHRPEQLAAGDGFTCVAQARGEVHCWGRNQYGRLGLGHVESLGDDEPADAAGPLELGAPVTALAAANGHACALRGDGSVLCWGENASGQLGHAGPRFIGDNETPTAAGVVELGGPARRIAVGGARGCAITEAGALLCWGPDVAPVDVGGSVVDVAISHARTCALLERGELRCWQPGIDDPAGIAPVELGGDAVAIAAGELHHCALLDTGEVRCWGSDSGGQLGDGEGLGPGYDDAPAAVAPVAIPEPVAAIAAGGAVSCAITISGESYCWGGFDPVPSHQVPLGYPGVTRRIGGDLVPADLGPIPLPGPVDAMTVGTDHICASIGGRVYCWGWAHEGALGYGSTEHLGDDELLTDIDPVPYLGGTGSGRTVDPGAPPFDGEVDLVLHLRGPDGPPPELALGELLDVRGRERTELGVRYGTHVVRRASDLTLLAASFAEPGKLDPAAADLHAPFEIELFEPDLCPPLAGMFGGCFGQRMTVEVRHPDAPSARLLDAGDGPVGPGYFASAYRVRLWDGPCVGVDERSHVGLDLLRRPCAPDCGPVAGVDTCAPLDPQPPEVGVRVERLVTADPDEPLDYHLSCRPLASSLAASQWHLDCVELP